MAQAKILIIDDEQDMCWAVEKAMQMEGFATASANSGTRGLELFLSENPSVVLVDLKMPDIDGFEVIKRIRENDSQIPIILITGHGNMDVAHEAMVEGSTGYIIKPFSMADLRAAVRSLVNEAQENKIL